MEEFKLIKEIRKRSKAPRKGLVLGIGDDCAVLEKDGRELYLWASDMIVDGTHFRIKDGYYKIGRKAVMVNISDIAAMGGIPLYITVSIGLPRNVGKKEALEIYKGIHDICSEYGMQLAGGDTVRSGKIVIDVSIIGISKNRKVIKCSGARPGEVIVITGPVRDGRKKHLELAPRLKESMFLTANYELGAMTDVSDGIALDAGKICSESGVGCLLYEEKIPLSAGLKARDAMHYGESFELLFTMSRGSLKKLLSARTRKNMAGFYMIGDVLPRSRGVKIRKKSGDVVKLEMKGYDHMAVPNAVDR